MDAIRAFFTQLFLSCGLCGRLGMNKKRSTVKRGAEGATSDDSDEDYTEYQEKGEDKKDGATDGEADKITEKVDNSDVTDTTTKIDGDKLADKNIGEQGEDGADKNQTTTDAEINHPQESVEQPSAVVTPAPPDPEQEEHETGDGLDSVPTVSSGDDDADADNEDNDLNSEDKDEANVDKGKDNVATVVDKKVNFPDVPSKVEDGKDAAVVEDKEAKEGDKDAQLVENDQDTKSADDAESINSKTTADSESTDSKAAADAEENQQSEAKSADGKEESKPSADEVDKNESKNNGDGNDGPHEAQQDEKSAKSDSSKPDIDQIISAFPTSATKSDPTSQLDSGSVELTPEEILAADAVHDELAASGVSGLQSVLLGPRIVIPESAQADQTAPGSGTTVEGSEGEQAASEPLATSAQEEQGRARTRSINASVVIPAPDW